LAIKEKLYSNPLLLQTFVSMKKIYSTLNSPAEDAVIQIGRGRVNFFL
jgi:hypothetical protein